MLGPTGFIGRATWPLLRRLGATLALACRHPPDGAESGPGVEWLSADLADPGAAAGLLERTAPQIVFNLAGYGVDPAQRDPGTAEAINARLVEGLGRALLQSESADWPGCRLVHCGSALEYGDCDGDLVEETEPRPTTLYGRTKLAGTRALEALGREEGLASVTARLFSVYGPGESEHRLLPALARARREGRPIELTEGRQERDFVYVEDVAEGLLRLGLARPAPGEVVNLATGRLTSVRRFVETAARILGIEAVDLRFGALPTRGEEMYHRPVSTERLLRRTGWTPPTDVEQGIRRTVSQERGHGA